MKRRSKYRAFIKALTVVATLLLCYSEISLSSNPEAVVSEKYEFFKPVADTLLARGADTTFAKDLITNPDVEFIEKLAIIKLPKGSRSRDYSGHYNYRSTAKTKDFLNANLKTLALAEGIYGVPKEIIASILWIETRHGSYFGNYHVASVFLSVAKANDSVFVEKSVERLAGRTSKKEFPTDKKDLLARIDRKYEWAIENLLAMEQIEDCDKLYGSYAGAFGISQFLPASYVNWAVDGDGDGEINLFDIEDAIFSVGNYLKTNGWGDTYDEKRAAVWHYNNSSAYVDAVFRLAENIGYDG